MGIINLDPIIYLEIYGLDQFLSDSGQFSSIIKILIVFYYISGSGRFVYLRPEKTSSGRTGLENPKNNRNPKNT